MADRPPASGNGSAPDPAPHAGGQGFPHEPFPRELSLLLIVAGIGGILLPGPVGAPLLVLGGISLWPRTFRPIDRYVRRRFPRVHREGTSQIARFLDDLERRYPADPNIPRDRAGR